MSGLLFYHLPPVPPGPSVIPRSDYNIKILYIKLPADQRGMAGLAILVLLFPSLKLEGHQLRERLPR